MEDLRVQPAHFMAVNRSAPDPGGRHDQPREEGRHSDERRAAPGEAPGAGGRLLGGAVRVEPLVDGSGRVFAVRVYDAHTGALRGEITPEELRRFADRHQAYVGILVERRL